MTVDSPTDEVQDDTVAPDDGADPLKGDTPHVQYDEPEEGGPWELGGLGRRPSDEA